jgi:hypothetical protein
MHCQVAIYSPYASNTSHIANASSGSIVAVKTSIIPILAILPENAAARGYRAMRWEIERLARNTGIVKDNATARGGAVGLWASLNAGAEIEGDGRRAGAGSL